MFEKCNLQIELKNCKKKSAPLVDTIKRHKIKSQIVNSLFYKRISKKLVK